MSAEAVQAFIEVIKADPVLQEKLAAAAASEDVDTLIVALGQEAGFDFTAEEWLDGQLDLDAVVGGQWSWWVAANQESDGELPWWAFTKAD